MSKCLVTVNKLNKRTSVPASLSDKTNIAGVVLKGFTFIADEVTGIDNPLVGKWFRDRDDYYYWAGGLTILEDNGELQDREGPDNSVMERFSITPIVKKKIEQVVNAFETGSAEGNYGTLVKFADYSDPETHTNIVQITYGRSQTTEFGHLKALVQDYVEHNGQFAIQLQPFISRIGKKPSLATDENFCKLLRDAGHTDPVMKTSQDRLFDTKYYQPAYSWFTQNGFEFPLSMLVIYDSYVHSGGILSFLRKRFSTVVPSNGGDEKTWITNYVNTRHQWLANHSKEILRGTIYRTKCFKQQIENDNWDLSQKINANGVIIV